MIGTLRPVTPSQIAALRANGDVEPLLEPGEVSVEKLWHALHFVLTGDVEPAEGPLGNAVLGGTPVGEDLGYGPARLLEPDEVRAVSAALDAIGEAALRARFDPAALAEAEIYPQIWEEDADELFDELWGYYAEMADCYRTAAKNGDGMLLAVT